MKLFDFSASPVLRFLTKQRKPQEPTVEPEVVNSLRSLINTPEWQRYKLLLDIYVSAHVKALLAAGDTEEVHRLRGYVQGLLHAAQIPEQIVQTDEHSKRRAARSDAAAGRRADSDRAALFATGFWGGSN